MKQWHGELKRFLGLADHEIGIVQADKCDVLGKKVVLAMGHSLCKPDRYPSYVYDWAGMMIIDEVHRVAAETFSEVCSLVSARLRLGLSATPRAVRRQGAADLQPYRPGAGEGPSGAGGAQGDTLSLAMDGAAADRAQGRPAGGAKDPACCRQDRPSAEGDGAGRCPQPAADRARGDGASQAAQHGDVLTTRWINIRYQCAKPVVAEACRCARTSGTIVGGQMSESELGPGRRASRHPWRPMHDEGGYQTSPGFDTVVLCTLQ